MIGRVFDRLYNDSRANQNSVLVDIYQIIIKNIWMPARVRNKWVIFIGLFRDVADDKKKTRARRHRGIAVNINDVVSNNAYYYSIKLFHSFQRN